MFTHGIIMKDSLLVSDDMNISSISKDRGYVNEVDFCTVLCCVSLNERGIGVYIYLHPRFHGSGRG
jgi:hypothetical protein